MEPSEVQAALEIEEPTQEIEAEVPDKESFMKFLEDVKASDFNRYAA